MEDLFKEMQKLQSKVSQNEREVKKRKMIKMRSEREMDQLKEAEKELTEKKKMVFRERRKLKEEERKIKWRLEELIRIESRTVPEIGKTGKEMQRLKKSLIWQETDFFNFQAEAMKLKRKYRQLLKKHQGVQRREGRM